MRKAKDAATLPLFPIEDYASEIIAGIDEAGRGPLCGNVVAAAVILDPARPIEGLRDSKKLSEARREELAPVIRERALAWGVGEATPEEIDRLNILQATFLAMQRALEGLTGGIRPTLVLVDGNRLPKIDIRAEAIVKGDDRMQAISAASILAKTSRDAELRRLDENIEDAKLSAQIVHMEEVTGKIFDIVAGQPAKLPQLRRFLNYYLPTTLKLLNAYDRMGAAGVEGANIDGTMGRIDAMMDKVVEAFDKQLDALFADEALDISTDITVLEQMLAQEGLGGMQMGQS